ncbi:MAG TPA: polyribonucleotide nucleotidyltransferase, partial [Planctomycetes bacterium]|nr:polyribonucleotide nucleotidyltransferase [Planctomycetota bacterium]
MTISKNEKVQSVSREIGGRTLTIESGWVAKQANGSVLVSYGETVVMSTAVDGGPRDLPFFPLTVDYREKTFSAGKIPGGFFKREARPSTKEVLAMRMLDRSVRPMFTPGYGNEVQVMSAVLSYDQENEPEVLSMIGGMAALHISKIPFEGPMAAVRLGWIDGSIVVNPTHSVLADERNKLDMTLSATSGAVCMVEAAAQILEDSEVTKALAAGHEICREICEMMDELREKVGSEKIEVEAPVEDTEALDAIRSQWDDSTIRKVLLTQGKFERYDAADALVAEIIEAKADEGDEESAARWKRAAKAVINEVERQMTLEGQRVDGRDTTTIRDIEIETGLLPRVHGSTLFTRGETQSIATTTLGSSEDEQFLDGLRHEKITSRFLLHYNFPPYCTGEAKKLFGTSRRELGHGVLAEKALKPILPEYEAFPYTIRVVSDITESNGSSSMATVCGGCLSMMDAGVPLKAPVAGIAMGMIADGDNHAILSDILGSEDHHGDMDFKVAGTREGITALQMDIKVKGLKPEVLQSALDQARDGRLHILDRMADSLAEPREKLSPYAPANKAVTIPTDKIGFLIGPKGANIRDLQETFGVTVNIVDDEAGIVQVSGNPEEQVDACIERIRQQTRKIEVGERFTGEVTSVKDFGCFVDLGGGQEGMCHISELDSERVGVVEDICKEGDEIEVVVVNVDERSGKIRISRKVALVPEEELEAAIEAARDTGPRGGGGRGRG